MKIKVGSKNKTKVDAVATVFGQSALFSGASVEGVEVKTDSVHPTSIEATIKGAMDRAKQAFADCDYSVGIESGLMAVPYTKSGYMELVMCVIYDGKQFHLGFGPGFEWPKKVTELILKGVEASDGLRQTGIVTSGDEKIGAANGGIWHLTKGKMDRTEQNRQAVMMALIHLENPEHF